MITLVIVMSGGVSLGELRDMTMPELAELQEMVPEVIKKLNG